MQLLKIFLVDEIKYNYMSRINSPKEFLLFYSTYCKYCDEVLSTLGKTTIKDKFMLVCVDKHSNNLPPFVDRVPLVFRPSTNEIIVDDDVLAYLRRFVVVTKPASAANVQKPQLQTESKPGKEKEEDEISPYSLQSNANYSDSFSFLEETSIDSQQSKSRYTHLNYEDRIMPMSSIDDENTSSSGKTKFDNSVLESYLQSRDTDTASFKQQMNNGFQPIVR